MRLNTYFYFGNDKLFNSLVLNLFFCDTVLSVRKNYGNKQSSIIDDLDSGAAPDASTNKFYGGESASTCMETDIFCSE